jgi:RNA polymerase sigma factor (TIGR02999 family)
MPPNGPHPQPPEDIRARVYAQLRALARRQMNAERPGHTLSATALVHEAYARLLGPRRVDWQSEAHFYTAAAQAMRRILIDHARARCAGRRGGPEASQAALNLTELPDPASQEDCAGFLILDDTISRLESADPQAAEVVRLRYFAGLTIEETARAMNTSEPTVKRAWSFARAWLKETIERDQQ